MRLMAFRIADIIQHGWIDNTSPGIIKGELYILGTIDPVRLFLKGNCRRDMAGSKVQFRNNNPVLDEETFATLLNLQKGVVGDMTCSLKRRSPTIPMTELEEYFEQKKAIPYEWKNAIYLEWFSIANGRVIIESSDFEITLSEHQWELSEVQEHQQKIENSQAMNQFMQLAIDMAEAESEISFETDQEVDEYEWEKRLRVKDQLDEAQWLLEENLPGDNTKLTEKFASNEEIPIKNRHALVQLAHHTHENVMNKLDHSILDNGPRGSLAAAISYVYTSMNDAWPDKGLGLESGYRLAVMKRTLLACNNSIANCNTLLLEDDDYEAIRTEIHHLRDTILDTIRHLRKQSPKKKR